MEFPANTNVMQSPGIPNKVRWWTGYNIMKLCTTRFYIVLSHPHCNCSTLGIMAEKLPSINDILQRTARYWHNLHGMLLITFSRYFPMQSVCPPIQYFSNIFMFFSSHLHFLVITVIQICTHNKALRDLEYFSRPAGFKGKGPIPEFECWITINVSVSQGFSLFTSIIWSTSIVHDCLRHISSHYNSGSHFQYSFRNWCLKRSSMTCVIWAESDWRERNHFDASHPIIFLTSLV